MSESLPPDTSGSKPSTTSPIDKASTTNNGAAASNAGQSSGPSTSSSWRARYTRFQGTRTYKSYAFLSKHRKGILLGASVLYFGSSYISRALEARKRDRIHDNTYLYWKIYDGSIVEAKSSTTAIGNLLFSNSGGGSDEPARVMTLFEVVRGLDWAMRNDAVKGIIADFSSLSAPAVQTAYSLGLAQIEEIADAIEELNRYKEERLGAENWRSIAFTDSFESQAQYTLASSFNEIYMQPTGEVPLVGVGSQIPFFRRLIDWLGIRVQAEAREEYKSFVAQYTSERLSDPQTRNQQELLNSLNDLMLERIARNRYERPVPTLAGDPAATSGLLQLSPLSQALGLGNLVSPSSSNAADAPVSETVGVVASSPVEDGDAVQMESSGPAALEDDASNEQHAENAVQSLSTTGEDNPAGNPVLQVTDANVTAEVAPSSPAEKRSEAFQKLKKLTFEGPFSAREAVENGLITGMSYRSHILDSIRDPEYGVSEDNKLMGFYHYCKVVERGLAKRGDPTLEVGVVYLLGAIGEAGEHDAGSVVRGLRQAGEDENIGCVVLRIDSGGGGVVDSDSIDQAVRDLREKKGKVVIASFSNSAASGGYMGACHADAIVAHPCTITGSIGVAALRPTFTPTFLDKIKITVQSLFTGSTAQDMTQELAGPQLEKHKRHVDDMYADFKNRVVEGREIHPDLINYLAGGRVYTGQMAYDLLVEANKSQEGTISQQQVDPPGTVRLPHLASSPKEPGQPGDVAVAAGGVQLAEGQEHSPFATVQEDVPSREDADDSVATASAGQVEFGPLGRGIIDGLGGIRDAAGLAAEVFLTRALAEIKLEQPEITDAQAIEQILPGMPYDIKDSQLTVPLDITLKQFPVEKSFWQLYKEASSQGDAMTDPSATSVSSLLLNFPHLIKIAFATWIMSSASKVVSSELDSLGLADVRKSMGIGAKPRGRAHMRAEMPKLSVR